MVFNKLSIFVFAFLAVHSLFAQDIHQNIRGRILDADNQEPLIGVTIIVDDAESGIGTVTDVEGYYKLENISIGRHQMSLSYVGYKEVILSEILVESGKESIIDLQLTRLPADLNIVVVEGQGSDIDRSYTPASIQTLSIEETLRFPATFYDPARLALSFAGVASSNDQANNISIRGHSPNHMTWQIEGVQIVNPNHLSNAGTLNDRVTANGGGVNILSAQMLGNSNFLTGAFPSDYGNALSGIMDMRLRKGNDEQHEFTGQIGLIGMDFAVEGPLADKASFLLNYRYSTLGLLSAMGVKLGDEAINFQDVAFNINIPFRKGSLMLFGMGGQSSNVFEAQRDTTFWEFEKDNQDIHYENLMGAVGARFALPIGQKTLWRNVVAYSGLQTSRQADLLDNQYNILEKAEFEELGYQILTVSSTLQHRLNSKNKLRFGVNISEHSFDYSYLKKATLFQSSVAWQSQPWNRWTFNVGLHYNYVTLGEDFTLEPRVSIIKNINNKQNLSLAYGMHSQMQRPKQYYIFFGEQSNELGLTKAHHIVLAYRNQVNNHLQWGAELYYQHLFDVPEFEFDNISISSLNLFNEFLSLPYQQNGKGRNYGLEMNLQQRVKNNFYYLVNASLYRSEYFDEEWLASRFDGNYIFNLTIGKEWTKEKVNRKNILGVNGRVTYLGVDALHINAEEDGVYFKTDLRIYYKRNRRKFSSTLALDIQNVSNQENIAYYYFDELQQARVRKNQLGLIPILSYRVEF